MHTVPVKCWKMKDHKPANEQGEYPTRLIVPARNFVSAFPKMGYKGIKNILDKHKVQYMLQTIIQGSDLKSWSCGGFMFQYYSTRVSRHISACAEMRHCLTWREKEKK